MKMKRLKKRHREILTALIEFGGAATTKEIAEKTGFPTNGVAQSLGVLEHVECVEGEGGDRKWKLVT